MHQSPRHYFETRLRLTSDPMVAATRLASSGLHADYVVYENGGTWSYAGGALAQITLDRDGARMRQAGEVHLPWDGRPLQQVRSLLDAVRIKDWRAYGWAAFELSYAKEGDVQHVGDQRLLHLVVPHTEVRIEGAEAHLRAADQGTLTALLEVLAAGGTERDSVPSPVNVRQAGADAYRRAVLLAVDAINDQRLQKVIYSRVVPVEHEVDFVGTYLAGRRGNSPARSFLLSLGGIEAAGFSPEIVVHVDPDGKVTSQPLAGTRALTGDGPEDERLCAELLSDPKEIYEHAISVKIACDELLDVCAPDTVDVAEFMTVKKRGTVQHLASRVSGRLAAGRHAWDAFQAVFPAVTASGVPKDAAYDSIRSNESEARGLYSGAVLTVDGDGSMDATLVLRSVYRQEGRTWLRAGAGIVGQSRPERELEETCEKLGSVGRFLVPAAEHVGTGVMTGGARS
ncbi:MULTISPECIES: salicylate synthase [unclassified Streptomyces]|uniref:salicylate synthase n=1 Tax=unclassified Streptomyces TaxID=2593676 RepID=UPI000DADB89E|nr:MULTISPECIES: salicylate synthase [unclassified Streptomyces]PZT72588.1 salicylate synthase [Streptomyces sp. AC1-42T]PZT81094.1 salicylate synthase [Streptomyces sp. AC1-42W]